VRFGALPEAILNLVAVFDLSAMSLRVGFYSASRNYDGLVSWIDLDNCTLFVIGSHLEASLTSLQVPRHRFADVPVPPDAHDDPVIVSCCNAFSKAGLRQRWQRQSHVSTSPSRES
jgi:hypothetical protein